MSLNDAEQTKSGPAKHTRRRHSRPGAGENEDALPTTHDLAASFLAQEPEAEKEELEAQVQAQSVDLRQSVSSNSTADDESNAGTGVGLALPTFLGDFLKKVVDQIKVRIKDVAVQTKLDIPLPGSSPSSPVSEAVTIVSRVAEVIVHEAKHAIQTSPEEASGSSSAGQTVHHSGRAITIRDIDGSLLTDKDFLSRLGPVTELTPPIKQPGSPAQSWPKTASLAASTGSPAETFRSISSLARSPQPPENLSQSLSSVRTDFHDAEDPGAESTDDLLFGEQSRQGYMSTYQSSLSERAQVSQVQTKPLDDDEDELFTPTTFGGTIEDSLRIFREERRPSEGSMYYSRASFPVSLRSASRTPSPPRQRRALHDSATSTRRASSPTHQGVPDSASVSSDLLSFSQPVPEQTDDLAQSNLYSHDDAQSLYMSMAGDEPIPSDVPAASSKHFSMPGGWGEESVADPSLSRQASAASTGDPHMSAAEADLRSGAFPSPGTETGQNAPKPSPLHLNSPETTQSLPTNHIETTIFNIDETELLVRDADHSSQQEASPDFSAHPHTADSTMLQSTTAGVPGSFSSYAGLSSRRRSSLASSRTQDPRSNPASSKTDSISRPDLKIRIGQVTCRVNITTCRILIQLGRRIQALFPPSPVGRATTAPASPPPWSSVSISLHRFIIEVADAASSQIQSLAGGSSLSAGEEKSLLALRIADSSIDHAQMGSASTKVNLGVVSFDVAGERVLSFSKDTALTESVRDVQASKDDIVVTQTVSQDGLLPEVSVLTMPLRIDLDFHRIDDTLSSFGGFSGLLELGSSILSESEIASTPPLPAEKPRAVRFDTSVKPPMNDAPSSGGLKLSCRVRGTDVMLRGKSTTIRYQSTPIKAILRDSSVVVQIDVMKTTAPYLGLRTDAQLEATASNVRFYYLAYPDERDLSRLISLLTPSKDKFEEEDDLLLDTLIRQRKKGAAARLSADELEVTISDLAILQRLQDFATELTKLSVAKYLPEESRPGLLTLGNLKQVRINVMGIPRLGSVKAKASSTEFAHIGAPSLFAVSIFRLDLYRADGTALVEEVVHTYFPNQPPMIMARMIGDELEPTLKVKLWNTAIEYSASLAETLMGYQPGQAPPDVASDLTASIATLTERPTLAKAQAFRSDDSRESETHQKPMSIDLVLRDCAFGLTPRGLPSKALLVITQARLTTGLPSADSMNAHLDLQKASLYLVDDVKKLATSSDLEREDKKGGSLSRNQLSDLSRLGYVSVFWLQAMTVALHLDKSKNDDPDILDIETKEGLMVMETCADSQKTMTDLLNALSPATPPAKGQKYQTEVAPLQDMMASFTGDAYAMREEQRVHADIEDSRVSFDDAQDVDQLMQEDLANDFDSLGGLPDFAGQDIESQVLESSILPEASGILESQDVPHEMIGSEPSSMKSEIITGAIRPSAMPPKIHGFAKKWDSRNNRYVHLTTTELRKCPVRVKVRDAHVIWNLHDGYDWEKTRDVISKAVYDVQSKAEERRSSRRAGLDEEENQPVIEDFLFNSIYIGVDVANADPKDLRDQINRNVDEMMTETGSHTSTTVTARPSNVSRPLRPHGKKLKLNRSKRHKITFELKGIAADIFMFQPGGETQSSVDVRVKDFEIFDHVPTSTWKKFATYMHDAGPREDKKPMLHLEICDVRPVPELTASELVLRVTVLPVRLHVDQDALDFLTRFFDFKDDESASSSSAPPDQPYLQRVEVRPVPVKLDFKPKRVDYAGLRSGRTSEFMNFFVLDGAAFTLKHVILYGCSGFLKLHHNLEDIWMPDVKQNQLPTVLSGLNGIRTIVNVGQGVRDLVLVPVQEYQKDGRIVRSIAKGVSAFGRSTGGEITRFGAKLAVGAQNYLQGAEEMLTRGSSSRDDGWQDASLDEEERAVSHYADQPAGILQGLKGAAKSLERDLLVAKDVIIAISGEVSQAESAEGAARAVVRNAPILILRPMIGASKAIGQTLMGATNTVDPENRRRVEDVSILAAVVSFASTNQETEIQAPLKVDTTLV